MRAVFERVTAAMGTVVAVRIVGAEPALGGERADRALDWFARIESRCSRFDPASELSQLSATCGTAELVSPLLFDLLRFALSVARESDGAFDPTVGGALEARGSDVHWRSGTRRVVGRPRDAAASWRDVHLDEADRTVLLMRPLQLDLGAVAKGLAVDLAARDLADFRDFAIDAGGDLYLAGTNAESQPWTVGIRHPRRRDEVIAQLAITDAAVCTSGDYERIVADGHSHLHDARAQAPATGAISATVVAPDAMTADALATAALVLGPTDGIVFLAAQGVSGCIVAPDETLSVTPMWSSHTIAPPNACSH